MKTLSKKEIFLILTPFIVGPLFIVTVYINHALFDNQIINARQAIGHEMLYFLTGLISLLIQVPLVIRWLFKKQWKPALLCVISAIVFWASIMFGGLQGAAIFYAT